MIITLGSNNQDRRIINKVFSSRASLSGSLKNSSSIVDPVIVVEYDPATMSTFNYMYIPSFNRYYYITDVVVISNTIVEIHAHCDVLKSFASEILSSIGIITKSSSSSVYSLLINDGSMNVYQPTLCQQKIFSNGFDPDAFQFVLACAGSPSD